MHGDLKSTGVQPDLLEMRLWSRPHMVLHLGAAVQSHVPACGQIPPAVRLLLHKSPYSQG